MSTIRIALANLAFPTTRDASVALTRAAVHDAATAEGGCLREDLQILFAA